MLGSMLHIDSMYIKFIFFLIKVTVFLYKKILLKYKYIYKRISMVQVKTATPCLDWGAWLVLQLYIS